MESNFNDIDYFWLEVGAKVAQMQDDPSMCRIAQLIYSNYYTARLTKNPDETRINIEIIPRGEN